MESQNSETEYLHPKLQQSRRPYLLREEVIELIEMFECLRKTTRVNGKLITSKYISKKIGLGSASIMKYSSLEAPTLERYSMGSFQKLAEFFDKKIIISIINQPKTQQYVERKSETDRIRREEQQKHESSLRIFKTKYREELRREFEAEQRSLDSIGGYDPKS